MGDQTSANSHMVAHPQNANTMKKNIINAMEFSRTKQAYLAPKIHIFHTSQPNILAGTFFIDGTAGEEGGTADPSTEAYSKINSFWAESPFSKEATKNFWIQMQDEDIDD